MQRKSGIETTGKTKDGQYVNQRKRGHHSRLETRTSNSSLSRDAPKAFSSHILESVLVAQVLDVDSRVALAPDDPVPDDYLIVGLFFFPHETDRCGRRQACEQCVFQAVWL